MSNDATFREALGAFQSGDLDRAEQLAREALKNGETAELLHLIGVLLCRRNSLAEGIESLERALMLQPANAGIRIHLVRALIDVGRGGDALALALRPAPGPAALDLWRLRAEAAAAASAFGEQREAERHIDLALTEQALAASPGDRTLTLRRGRLLATFMRDDLAEADFRQLHERDPADIEVVAELGRVLDRNNRVDELEHLLEGARGIKSAEQALAGLEAVAAWRRKDLASARRWLDRADPAADPVLHYALLAKVADAQGDIPAAIAAVRAKNEAIPRRAEWLEQSSAYRAKIRAFADSLTDDWFGRFAGTSSGDRAPPVFLLGFPRSGTTLLDTFLMGDSDIAVLEEQPLIGRLIDELGGIEQTDRIDDSRAEQLRSSYFDRLDRLVDSKAARLVVDKMPINTLAAPLIYRLFPNAKVIFAQRHPCDCVVSGLSQAFDMNPAMASFLDPAAAADFYDVALDIWTKSAAHLPIDRHVLRYEDLVSDPERVMRGLAAYLGLEWSGGLADHRNAARARGRISTASYDQVTQPLHQRSIGRWTRYRDLLGPGLPTLLRWAERLGYPAED